MPGDKSRNSRLYFSVVVVWFGDGRMSFIIVYQSKAKNKPRWTKFGKGEGVYWFRAESKWTTKKTYTEMLRGLVLFGSVLVFLDDHAGGHAGVCPDRFLRACARRVRVPKRATCLVQLATDPGTTETSRPSLTRRAGP